MTHPEQALATAHRLLRPGGRLLVVDLAPHGQSWVLEKLGHRHLGFSLEAVAQMLAAAGFVAASVEEVHQRRDEVFRVILAFAQKRGPGRRAARAIPGRMIRCAPSTIHTGKPF